MPAAAVSSVVYTSGSTSGVPRGAMLSERVMLQDLTAYTMHMVLLTLALCLECAPLAWLTARVNLRTALASGGAVALYRGPPHGIWAEIKAVEPTWMVAVPGVWAELRAQYLSFLRTHARGTVPAPDSPLPLLNDFRQTYPLGRRLESVTTGGAFTPPSLLSFLSALFASQSVHDGLGSTETGSLLHNGELAAGTKAMLIGHADLGYTRADKPWPRGELAVRNQSTCSGYLGDPEATAAKLTPEGFWRTGDVVEQLSQDRFRFIDRVTNVFKLSNGTFVSPEVVEAACMRCELVAQVFVYGDATRPGVVCVAVPDMGGVAATLRAAVGDEPEAGAELPLDASALLSLPAVRELVWSSLVRACVSTESLSRAHYPLLVHLAPEAFDARNGLLTPSGKPSRTALAKHFKREIEEMYLEVERRGRALVVSPHGSSSGSASPEQALHAYAGQAAPSSPSLERLSAILCRVLAVSHASMQLSHLDMRSLGMSSMQAMQLVQAVKAETGTELPVALLMASQESSDASELMGSQATGPVAQLHALLQHGAADPHSLHAMQQRDQQHAEMVQVLLCDMQLPLMASSTVPAPASADAIGIQSMAAVLGLHGCVAGPPTCTEHILLTGASGFLGGQLLHDLLVRHPSCFVHCLLRAEIGAASEQQRLEAVNRKLLNELQRRDVWPHCSDFAQRIAVHPADIGAPLLGLSDVVYWQLARCIDSVYHSAAAVNWVLSYASVRWANVLGTAHLLRLAADVLSLGRPPIAFRHVSSLGVLRDVDRDASDRIPHAACAADLSLLQSSAAVTTLSSWCRDRAGYDVSKWAAEFLVCRAQLCRLISPRSTIFRPGFIGPHSRTGDSGPADFVTRYLRMMLLHTRTFVDTDGPFEMTSVDAVAHAIITRAEATEGGRNSVPPAAVASQAAGAAADSTALSAPQVHPICTVESDCLTFSQLGWAAARTLPAEGLSVIAPCTAAEFVDAVGRTPQCELYPLLGVISQQSFFGGPQAQQGGSGAAFAGFSPSRVLQNEHLAGALRAAPLFSQGRCLFCGADGSEALSLRACGLL